MPNILKSFAVIMFVGLYFSGLEVHAQATQAYCRQEMDNRLAQGKDLSDMPRDCDSVCFTDECVTVTAPAPDAVPLQPLPSMNNITSVTGGLMSGQTPTLPHEPETLPSTTFGNGPGQLMPGGAGVKLDAPPPEKTPNQPQAEAKKDTADESKTQSAAKQEPMGTSDGTSCGNMHKDAEMFCQGQQYASAVNDTIATFTYAKSTDNVIEACRQAKKVFESSAAATGGMLVSCQIAVSKCKNACRAADPTKEKNAKAYFGECQGFDKNLQMGAAQIMSDMQNLAKSQACVDALAAAGTCGGPDAFTNPQCPDQYCANPINANVQTCIDRANLCSLPQYTNTLTCYCQGNPGDTRCTGNAATPIAGLTTTPSALGSKGLGTIGSGTPKFDTSDDNTDPQDFGGNPAAQTKAAQAAYEDNKGGGLGGGGGAVFGGGNGTGARGKAEGPYNTDVYRGVSSAGGGGVSYGGGGGYNGSGAGSKGGGGDATAAVDWRKFMPKLDQKRAPANVSAELYNAGITAANGLSNFEKITRKMNEKRGTLLP